MSEQSPQHLVQRLMVFTGSSLATVLWVVLVISALAFMIITAARMSLEKQARELMGNMPSTYHPLNYKEKKRQDSMVFHLAMDVRGTEAGRMDVYGLQGGRLYNRAHQGKPSAVLALVQDEMGEFKNGIRNSHWGSVGIEGECRMMMGRDPLSVVAVAFVMRENEATSGITVYARSGQPVQPPVALETMRAQGKRFCDEMKGIPAP